MVPMSFIEEVTQKTDIKTLVRDYVDLDPVGD